MAQMWRDAFERRPGSRPERAVSAVAEDPECVPLSQRPCKHCGGELVHPVPSHGLRGSGGRMVRA